MQFFIDSANLEEIQKAKQWGFIDGATTNPSLVAKSGRTREQVIAEICQTISGPVSAEVLNTDYYAMVEEGKKLAKIHSNVVVKLPMTEAGIMACKILSQDDIKTNVTLVFSSNQALIAAKNGATYVSPFIGRLDDIGHDGMQLIQEIKQVFLNYDFETKILAASIRGPSHLREAALIGADVATVPFKVFQQIFHHPLSDIGLETFLRDANQSTEKEKIEAKSNS